MICNLFSEPSYFIFSADVPVLLYYAHIPTILIAFFFGFYIFLNDRKSLLNRLLFSISFLVSIWMMINLITWTNIHSNLILFFWSFFGLVLSLIAILCIYFIYVFLEKKDVSIRIKIIFLTLLAPSLFLTVTRFNLSGFDITNCDAFKFEWLPFKIYYTLLGVLALVWVLILLVRKYRNAVSDLKKQIVLMGLGIELFLFLFFVMIFLASYLTQIGLLADSELEMYGLIGVLIFIVYINILIVRFKTFNVKLLATQALVWGLVILIGSQFFFIKTSINFVLNGITFLGAVIFGFLLIKSVKKEIKQKENLAKLNTDLEKLITQRESLVHLVTHKVKGSFTRTKYIFAGMLDGMFGDVNPEMKKIAQMGLESDDNGVKTVDLILNAANLQKGTVKYDLKPINLKDLVQSVLVEKKEAAEKKGLQMEVDMPDDEYKINADVFWLKEVVNNIIENSVRYTKVGSIKISLEKKDSKILFIVKDTGIGVSEEDKKNLFTEGGRGKESVKVNVDSTGYGLYTVKLVVEAHGGRVWVESEGSGKGSVFYVELAAI